MAAECLEFPPIEAVAIEEEKMAPAKTPDVKGWLTLVFTVICTVGGATWGIAHEFSELGKHISRVETAVRIIGAKQGGDTQTLVDESLKVAQNDSAAGHEDRAKTVLAIANRILKEQKEAHASLPQEAFSNALVQYQTLKKSPALRSAAHEGIVQLAEYRTILAAPVVTPPPQAHIGHLTEHNGIVDLQNAYLVGNGAIANNPEGTDIDGFIMQNVVFENVTIIYRGGPLSMRNVRFINCKFKVSDSPQGDQLLTAAIEQQTDAQIS